MKHTSKILMAALLLVSFCVGLQFAVAASPLAGILAAAATFALASPMIVLHPQAGRLYVTLTSTEILMDVIEAFAKRLPILPYIGADWRATPLKLNQTYKAHVPSIPAVEDITNANYGNMTGQTARSLMTDVDVLVDAHKGARIKWQHLYSIQDKKQEYDKIIGLSGYALAKSVIDSIIGKMTTENFSQHSLFAVADSDCDMLDNICGDLNTAGAFPSGRFGVVNTAVANVLAGDSRLTSADYAGQRVRGEGYRRWTDVNGFAEIMEYPDLANTTSGTALTSVTAANSGDLFTKASHGLSTGQTVTAASFSAGFSDGTYYVIRVSANTFQLATSYANAIAGTAAAVSADGTGGVITPTQTLTGFFGDMRAITLLGGVPDGIDTVIPAGINVNRVQTVEVVTHPELGISMAAITWQDAGTGDINWIPTLVFGTRLGRNGATNAPGSTLDYAGHRLVSA